MERNHANEGKAVLSKKEEKGGKGNGRSHYSRFRAGLQRYRELCMVRRGGTHRFSSCPSFPCIPCICRMIDGRVNFIGIRYRCGLSSSARSWYRPRQDKFLTRLKIRSKENLNTILSFFFFSFHDHEQMKINVNRDCTNCTMFRRRKKNLMNAFTFTFSMYAKKEKKRKAESMLEEWRKERATSIASLEAGAPNTVKPHRSEASSRPSHSLRILLWAQTRN